MAKTRYDNKEGLNRLLMSYFNNPRYINNYSNTQEQTENNNQMSYTGGNNLPDPPKKKRRFVVFAEAPTTVSQKYSLQDENKNIPSGLKSIQDKINVLRNSSKKISEEISADKSFKANESFIIKSINDALNDPKRPNKEKEILGTIINNYKRGGSGASQYLLNIFLSGTDASGNVEGVGQDLVQKIRKNSFPIAMLDRSKKINAIESEISKLSDQWNAHPENIDKKQFQDFIIEANNLKKFYKRTDPSVDVEIRPVYKSEDNVNFEKEISSVINSLGPEDEVALLGHHGSKLAGYPASKWGELFSRAKYKNCYLGSCRSEDLAKSDFKNVKNLYYRPTTSWYGINPNASNITNAFFSRVEDEKTGKAVLATPKVGRDYIYRK